LVRRPDCSPLDPQSKEIKIVNCIQEITSSTPSIVFKITLQIWKPEVLRTRNLSNLRSGDMDHGPPQITNDTRWDKWDHSEVLTMHAEITADDKEQTQESNTPSIQATSCFHQIINIRNYNNLKYRILDVLSYVTRT